MAPSARRPASFTPIDFGNQHGRRLAQHRRLGLDAAHAPAEHADAVDHRGVRVGADHGVRVGEARFVREHDARQVLEVDLVDDSGVRRHDGKVVERGLAPAQEGIALAVALELEQGVQVERIGRAVVIHHDGMVDHELGRNQRVDARRVAPELGHRVPHRGEVDDRRHAGEVLHDHARRRECDLALRQLAGIGLGKRKDVLARDASAVLVAKQVLEQDLQRVGESSDVGLADGVEREVLVAAAAGLELAAGLEAVLHESSSG